MKKKLLILALSLFVNFVIFAQNNEAQGQTNAQEKGFHFDITTLLIGLVVGGGIGYFLGSKKSAN